MFDRANEPKEPTMPGFVAWLERKDPNERYDWPRSEICACGQYATELGVKNWQADHNNWHQMNMLARGPIDLDQWETASEDYWTFGKLLARAKELLPTE